MSVTPWWLRIWGGVAVVTAALSPLVLGVAPAVTTWVAGFIMSLIASGMVSSGTTPFDRTRASGTAALWGGAFTALTAALQVIGPAALWWVVAAAVSSPPLRRAGHRFLRAQGVQAPPEGASARPDEHHLSSPTAPHPGSSTTPARRFVPVAAGQAATMSIALLCHAWRCSYLWLEAARDSAETLEVVRVRQVLLDELHRRHRSELRAWISAGGRAASGPERFLGPAALGAAPRPDDPSQVPFRRERP